MNKWKPARPVLIIIDDLGDDFDTERDRDLEQEAQDIYVSDFTRD